MKVYIVISETDCGGLEDQIEGVFTTEDAADARLYSIVQTSIDGLLRDDASAEEYLKDELEVFHDTEPTNNAARYHAAQELFRYMHDDMGAICVHAVEVDA